MPDYESDVRKNLKKNIDALNDLKGNARSLFRNYKQLLGALQKLNDMTDAQYETEKQQPDLPVSTEILRQFQKAYKDAQAECEFYLNYTARHFSAGDLGPGVHIVQSVMTDLSHDLNVITDHMEHRKPASFGMIMNEARVPVLDIGDKDIQTVGGAMSSRIPFSYTLPAGRKLSGVFTRKNYFDSEAIFKDQFRELGEAFPAYEKLFKLFYPAYLKREGKKDTIKSRLDFTFDFFDYTGRPYKDIPSLCSGFSKYCDSLYPDGLPEETEELFDLPDYPDAVEKFHHTMDAICRRIGINLGNGGIAEYSRIDSRNSAMTAVADMLGMPNLLARSYPLKVRYKGEEIEGTFMEKGLGMHIGRPTKECKSYGNATFQTNGLKSISDMMVLDFICGNPDRHQGNVMYIFDTSLKDPKKHRFLGVQGIDNDCSFGTITGDKEHPRHCMAALNDIKAIGQSTAYAVLHLKPEMLKFKLREMEITEEQIAAAAERLKMLQEKIEKAMNGEEEYDELRDIMDLGRDYSKTKLKDGQLLIVPDRDFRNLPLSDLAPKSEYHKKVPGRQIRNLYNVLLDFNNIVKDRTAGQATLRTADVNKAHGFGVLPDEYDKAARTLDTMEDVTTLGYTSPQFETLRDSIRKYSEFCRFHKNQLLTEAEYRTMRVYLNNIGLAANAYLGHKREEEEAGKKHSGYAKKRITAVENIAAQYAEKLSRMDKDLYAAYNLEENRSAKNVQHEYEERNTAEFNARMRAEVQKLNAPKIKETTFSNLRRNLEAMNRYRNKLNDPEAQNALENPDDPSAQAADPEKQLKNLEQLLKKNCAAFVKARVDDTVTEFNYSTNINLQRSSEHKELSRLLNGIDKDTQDQFKKMFGAVLETMHTMYAEKDNDLKNDLIANPPEKQPEEDSRDDDLIIPDPSKNQRLP